MPDRDEETLRAAYRAFNERDVAAYWARQFEQISSRVEPRGFSRDGDCISVDVHQVVRDADSGELVSDSQVVHRWRLERGLVVRMDVVEPAAGAEPVD